MPLPTTDDPVPRRETSGPAIDRALDDAQHFLAGETARPQADSFSQLMAAQNRITELEIACAQRDEVVASLETRLKAVQGAQQEDYAKRCLAEKTEKETRAQFDDLKVRLHAAERANEFARGYLARVQEDDTVRDELVTVGDPNGESQLVPKRKPTAFPRPTDYTDPSPDVYASMAQGYGSNRERGRSRHWITY